MSDVHAEHAPEALMDPAISWGTLGAHVVAAQRALAGGVVYHPLVLAKLLTQDSVRTPAGQTCVFVTCWRVARETVCVKIGA